MLASAIHAAGRLAAAMLAYHFCFAHQFDTLADDLHRERVVAHADAFVIRHKVPPLQGVASDGSGIRAIDVALEPHGRTFEIDPNQLHAIIGFDHHLGEVRCRRNSTNSNRLRAHRLLEFVDNELRIVGRCPAAELHEELLHPRKPFGRWIDRAVQHRRVTLGLRWERTQRSNQVLQFNHRATRGDAPHPAIKVFGPRFGWPGNDNVASFRVTENVLNASQTSEILHHIVGATSSSNLLGNCLLQAGQRHHAQVAYLGQVALKLSKRSLDSGAGEFSRGVWNGLPA